MTNTEILSKRIDDYSNTEGFFGVIRVTCKDKILFEKSVGYANIEQKTPFTKDSEFVLYSLSKPFCAIGLMLLVDKGLVDLDAHPKKYLPEAEGFNERVTIRQMLHHVGGLPDFAQTTEFAQKYATENPTDDRALTKIITAYPQFFEPNTSARYCTSNFTYCALIIENVAKMPYAEYMRENVFLPLGMAFVCVLMALVLAFAGIAHRVAV